MKLVGQVLQHERVKQKKTIDDIASLTFISPEYLEAIEANAFDKLPSVVSTQGFLGSYAEVLGLSSEKILALLRRDFERKADVYVPVTSSTSFTPHPRRAWVSLISGVVIVLLVVIVYGVWSVLRLQEPPDLLISTPPEGATVRSPVVVRGQTASDAVVEVDGQPVALTQDGVFAREQDLTIGKHTITVVAKNRQGRATIEQVTVVVER